MEAISVNKTTRLVFALGLLVLLSATFIWRGAGRMLQMHTQAAKPSDFAQFKPHDEAKFVVEVENASESHLQGKLLSKNDETHYSRTDTAANIQWNKETKIIMGKVNDLRRDAVLHVTGTVQEDHGVRATQIVILTGYVQVN